MSNEQNISASKEANCFSGRGHSPSVPDIPLQDLPPARLRGCNGFPILEDDYRPPNQTPEALDERLYDDLCRGVYDCPICTDTISVESEMWSCKDCHHIYHFQCAIDWATRSKGAHENSWKWPCPTCKRSQKGGDDMRPACWCGRWRQDHVKVIGNSCGKRCPGYKTCESPGPKCERFCRKVCHPGPCEPVVCVKTCILEGFPHFKTGKKAVMHEYRAPRPPPQAHMARSETVAAERSRYSAELTAEREARGEPEPEPPDGVPQLQKGEISVMIFLFLILAGVETGLAFWVKFHIARWTQPLKYKHFVENGRDGEHVAGIVFGCIFCGVFNGVVACLASFTLRRALCHYFRIPRGSGRRFLMLIFVVLFIAACVLPFPIGYLGGPAFVWEGQMQRSCDGFESRAKLDGIDGTSIAATKFFLHEPRHRSDPDFRKPPAPRRPGLDTFNITTRQKDSKKSKDKQKSAKLDPEPFSSYHRLSGAFSADKHLFVDFDLTHFRWRILTQANATVGETLIRNGTWTNTTFSNPHATFPELNLQAPNLYFFSKNCLYQPFLTVFRTDGMGSMEIKEQSEREWSKWGDHNVVMRATSFGQGQNGLEVCARRREYNVPGNDNRNVTREGLHDDVIIPLGLMATLRRQMKKDNKLPNNCWEPWKG